jgi:hypothetical protein
VSAAWAQSVSRSKNFRSLMVAPLNNKQFYQGIIEPLTEGVFAFYLNWGIPPDVLFYLLVSGIETVTVNGDKISYEGLCSYLERCFYDFVETWNREADMPPRAFVTNQPMEIGPKVAADAKALVAAASAGLTAKADGKLVQFSKKGTKTTICVADASGTKYVAVGISNASVFKTPALSVPRSDDECPTLSHQNSQTSKTSAREAPTVERQLLRLRSVQAIFAYLGFLVREDKNSIKKAFKYPVPNIGFNISEQPPPEVRFATQYQGKNYYVSEVSENDNTLRILALLDVLLNLNRDANAIPKTPAVQAIGG